MPGQDAKAYKEIRRINPGIIAPPFRVPSYEDRERILDETLVLVFSVCAFRRVGIYR